MRIWHLAILFVLTVLVAGIATLPLSVALNVAGADATRLTYERAEGSVWNGTLTGAALGQVPLGTVSLKVDPLALFGARLAGNWSVDGVALNGSGQASLSMGRDLEIKKMRLRGAWAQMPTAAPMTGSFSLDIPQLVMGPSGCKGATGTIKSNPTLQYAVDASWAPPALLGSVACDGKALSVPIKGDKGNERVDITFLMRPDLSFAIAGEVETADEPVRNAMMLMGFERKGRAYAFHQKGSWGRKRRKPRSGE